MRKLLLASLVCFASVQSAFAEEEFGDDDDEFGDFYGGAEFVSIATGTKKSVDKAPSVATVITSEKIKASGATNIHQVIELVTGIHVYPSNFNRMNPSYSVRGIHSNLNPQILVLVNGNKTRSNWTGAKWDLFNVGVETVERIEVIKGPGSAVHGADAFSGVINIVTKGYDSDSPDDVGVKIGSFGTRTSWLNVSGEMNDYRIWFNGQYATTDGDRSRIVSQDAVYAFGLSAISNAPGPLDTRLDTLDLHLGFQGEHFFGDLWYLDNDGGTGSGAAQALSNNDRSQNTSLTAKLGYKTALSEQMDFEFFTSYQSYEQDTNFVIFPPGMALPRAFDPQTGAPTAFTVFPEGVIGRPLLFDDNYNTEVIVNYSGFVDQNIRISAGYLRIEMDAEEFKNFGPLAQDFTEDFRDGTLTDVTGTPFIFSPDENRNVYYLSLQDEWAFAKDWELTAGIRYDNYSDFGSTINPRVALVWQAKHNLTAKALYGRSFRAPSISELYAINNPVILGNPDLDAETINTFEIAFDYRPNFDWKLLFNLFSYKANNLIIYTAQGNGTSEANNAAQQDGIGFEFEAFWSVTEQLKLKLGYAWQDAEDKVDNTDVTDAPQKMLDFSVDWEVIPHLNLHLDTSWVNDRQRSPLDPRPSIEDYVWTNANIAYEISSELDISLSVRNVFDESAYEPSDGQIPGDFPLEERGYWISAAYQF